MILAFAHPGIVVPDLDAAQRFYEAMFGFRVVGEEAWSARADRAAGTRGENARGLMLAGHNCFLELWQFDAPGATRTHLPNEAGLRHLAFYVDDCRAEHARLLRLGGQPLGQPTDLGGGAHAVYARDPFGNIIELCEIASEHEHPARLPGVRGVAEHGTTEDA
jgi:catechol 2,3-dioxygenase-like lactoylglutathione lyase family enzyme